MELLLKDLVCYSYNEAHTQVFPIAQIEDSVLNSCFYLFRLYRCVVLQIKLYLCNSVDFLSRSQSLDDFEFLFTAL